ncbi:hypothetical protein TSACC_115 [Terrimicrobium sacchariphilum]|uniref:Uncharacterized protein n=1 Tax=Terrimicrobium sacchariphilum TaxID=690879 RepID=A0A146G319_TERSA|nr:hypothetical protein TSACC_115 [Terrimicrobium sacchariphilum]
MPCDRLDIAFCGGGFQTFVSHEKLAEQHQASLRSYISFHPRKQPMYRRKRGLAYFKKQCSERLRVPPFPHSPVLEAASQASARFWYDDIVFTPDPILSRRRNARRKPPICPRIRPEKNSAVSAKKLTYPDAPGKFLLAIGPASHTLIRDRIQAQTAERAARNYLTMPPDCVQSCTRRSHKRRRMQRPALAR